MRNKSSPSASAAGPLFSQPGDQAVLLSQVLPALERDWRAVTGCLGKGAVTRLW